MARPRHLNTTCRSRAGIRAAGAPLRLPPGGLEQDPPDPHTLCRHEHRSVVAGGRYIDIAIHCRARGISDSEALARIKAKRPIADPNPGFLAQLQRLWP